MRMFRNVEELRQALAEFRERYNQRWIVQRLATSRHPGSPAAPCARSCCMNTLSSVSKKSEGAGSQPEGGFGRAIGV